MKTLDIIVVVTILLGTLSWFGRHYYKKWTAPPSACGGSCGCGDLKKNAATKR